MASVKLRLDKRAKANGLHNVKVAVYHKNEKKFFATKVDLSEKDFATISQAVYGSINLRRSDKIRDKELLEKRYNEANYVIKDLGNRFSYYRFKELYSDSKDKRDSLEYLFDQDIKDKRERDKIGSAVSFNNSKQSLLTFAPNATIKDVTIEFLEKYQRWMNQKGKSRTTIGIYLRSLRVIYNKAIRTGLVNLADYPFKKGGYKIPKGHGRKIALEAKELVMLLDYKPSNEAEAKALDFFWISYHAAGLNFADIIQLRQSNFIDGEIVLIRKKTEDTDSTIHIPVTGELDELIARRRVHKLGNNPLVFDIIDEEDNPETQNKKLRQFIKTTNKYLKRIACEKLKLSKSITTYTARHSWATYALNRGLTNAEISKALGHQNINTTEAYLDGFAKEKRKESAEKVADIRSSGGG